MYAVVKSGGKQVRVSPGESIWVERIEGEIGSPVELADVLLVAGEGEARIGTPTVAGAKVVGKITEQGRGEKIIVFKMKRRKNYRRKQGHRQYYTQIHIERIEG